MGSFFQEIIERRVLQAVGVYVGGSWVLVEIIDRMVDRYLLSPHISELVFWGLYSLLPAIALVAWTHGKPGKDKITRTEIVGIPANLIATLGLLVNLAQGKELGSTAEAVTLANEFGQTETHYVPKDNFRRRMASFFWSNDSGNPEYDWLQYGMASLLAQDLSQNPYILVNSPYSGWANGYYARMKQANYANGLKLPLTLMREIAEESNRQLFITGAVTESEGEITLTAKIYDTDTLQEYAEIRLSGWNLLPLVDQMSVRIKDILDVPKGGGRLDEDLPLAETFGESREVLKTYVVALNERLFNNDFIASTELLSEAVEEDPGFVMGHFLKGVNLAEQGRIPEAQAALQEAQKLNYRLPAVDQSNLKSIIYRLQGDSERQEALLKMQVELRGDAQSYNSLGNFFMFTGAYQEAKKQFELALQKDSLALDVIEKLTVLERASDDLPAALKYAEKLQELKPESLDAEIILGDLQRDMGQIEAARIAYNRAQLVDVRSVLPLLRLAELESRQGNWQAVENYHHSAQELVSIPQEEMLLIQSRIHLALRLGKIHQSLSMVERQLQVGQEFLTPLQQGFSSYFSLAAYQVMLGQIDEAQASLDELGDILQPPFDEFIWIPRILLLAEQGDFQAANAAVERGQAAIDQFRMHFMQFNMDINKGVLAEREGDLPLAAENFRSAVDLIRTSILGAELQSLGPSILSDLARVYTEQAEFGKAQQALDEAFQVDKYEPLLHLEQARLHLRRGQPQLANASIQYALAIWQDADPDYVQLQRAQELAGEIEAAL